jgi:hypothetical protein
MPKKQGRKASSSGRKGEDIFYAAVYPYVTNIVGPKEESALPYAVYQPLTNHPYRDEPRSGKGDYMLYLPGCTVLVQIKRQSVGGTVDEKLGFTFDIASSTLQETPFDIYLLVLLGDHWPKQPGILDYCKSKANLFDLMCGQFGLSAKSNVIVGEKELATYLKDLFAGGVSC